MRVDEFMHTVQSELRAWGDAGVYIKVKSKVMIADVEADLESIVPVGEIYLDEDGDLVLEMDTAR